MTRLDADPTDRLDKKILPRWVGVGLIACVCAGLTLDGFWRDHESGRGVVANADGLGLGAYHADPACPTKAWAQGDYLPFACMRGNVLRDAGFQRLSSFRDIWIPRRVRWVRAGADALLVATPPLSGHGEIVQIAAGRFPPDARGQLPMEGRAANSALFDYWLAYLGNIVVRIAFVIFLVVAAFVQYDKERRRQP